MRRAALEYLSAIDVSIAVSLRLVELNSDPVTRVLAFNLANIFDRASLTLVLERDELDALPKRQISLGHTNFKINLYIESNFLYLRVDGYQ